MSSRVSSLDALLADGLRDLLDGERQLQRTLGDLVPLANSPALKQLLRERIAESDEHARRATVALRAMQARSLWKRSVAMEGLLAEAIELLNTDTPGEVTDLAIVACLQRVAHYEVATASLLCTYAADLHCEAVSALLARIVADERRLSDDLPRLVEQWLGGAAGCDQTVSGGVRAASSGGGSWTGTGGGSSVGVTGASSGRSVSSI